MKYLIFLISLLIYNSTWSQKSIEDNFQPVLNVIKFRVIPSPVASSFGLGYERRLTNKMTGLFLLNYFVFSPGSEGGATIYKIFAPELRYNFSKYHSRSEFVSSFLEIGRTEVESSNYEIDINDYRLSDKTNFLSFGFLIGKNLKIGDRVYFDAYLGPKLKLQKNTIIDLVQNESVVNENTNLVIRARLGVNINVIL